MILLTVSFLVLAYTALQLNRYFAYRRLFDWALGLFLILFALIVFSMTACGLFYQMNNPVFVLGFQIALLAVVLLIARLWMAPKLARFPYELPSLSLKAFDLPAAVSFFLVITAGVGLLNLVYTLFVPPNNNDSLALHLARIGMWDQTGSWLPWNTKVIWQLTFPFNAEAVSYWTLLFTRSEHLLGLVTYLAGYLSIAVVYQLAHELTQKPGAALTAALAWAALPVVQLNFTSTRHDHPSSLLILAAIYYFYFHLKQKNRGYLALAGLATGLAIGTNYSVIGYLPGLALIFALYWLVFKRINTKELLTLAGSSVLAFLLFSSPIYISNTLAFGSALGPEALEMTSHASAGDSRTAEHIGLMIGRWAYQLVDLQGVPEPYLGKLLQVKAWLPEQIADRSGLTLEKDSSLLNQHVFDYTKHIPFSEDSAWFGVVGAFLFVVVSIYVCVAAFKKRHPLMVFTAILLVTAPVALALVRSGWTPYDGRYFITLAALLALGLAALLDGPSKRLATALMYGITILSVLTLLISIYGNPAKSFWGYRAFWKQHRFDSVSAQSYDTKEMLYLVDQAVPEDAVLGIATTGTVYYEYGLFGEHFTRRIVPVYPDERVCDPAWLDEQGIQYLLVDYGVSGYPGCALSIYRDVQSMKNWIVFER